jgi:preprotein translocase subunit SecE
VNAFFQELFRVGLYKRTQGRIARQVTFAAVAVSILAGAYQAYGYMITMSQASRLAIPSVMMLAGIWVAYRLVNLPIFADFLIAVEAEMNKVSWPTRSELYRSSIVVLVTVFVLAVLLFAFDFAWGQIFMTIDVVPGESIIEQWFPAILGDKPA